MEFKTEKEVTKEQWSQFIMKSEEGNIFNSPEFYEIHKVTGETEPYVIFCTEDSEIKGIMVTYLHKEKLLRLESLTSRSIAWGSPIFNGDEFVLHGLLKHYLEKKPKCIYTQIRNLYNTDLYSSIFENFGFKRIDHLDIKFNLKVGIDELWKNIHKYRRHNIKSCYKKGMWVRIIEQNEQDLLNSTYDIISNVYRRVNLPLYSKSFFKLAFTKLIPVDKLKVFGAFLKDKLIAVRYILCFKKSLYDWYSGADKEYLKYRPNDILPWEVIKWGVDNNYEVFDFGGAGKPRVNYGVRDFKMKFGGQTVNYGRYEIIHNKFLMSIGRFGFFLKKKLKF